MKVDVLLGFPKPDDNEYLPIVENNGTDNFTLVVKPGEGIYVKVTPVQPDI